jgi:two-component system, OmpR family, response regulator MprA
VRAPATRSRVLVVDDDPALRRSVARILSLADYDVAFAAGGAESLEVLARERFSLVVLDVAMPPPDGVEVCRTIRARGDDTPVLMLTARASVPERVDGLESGADDYLVKPFAVEELLARVRALLRRAPVDPGSKRLRYADLDLNPATREVSRGDRKLELGPTEFALLELFLSHPRQVLPRGTIYDAVWGYDFGSSSKSLEVYVGYLRRKTEEGGAPRLIQTVRGVGYALREQ